MWRLRNIPALDLFTVTDKVLRHCSRICQSHMRPWLLNHVRVSSQCWNVNKKIIVLVEKNVYKLNSPAPIFSSTGQLLARQNNLEFPTAPRGGCCHSRHDTKGEYFLDPKVKVEIEMKMRYTAQLQREESREMILFPPETSPAGAAIRTCHGSCMRHPPELGFHIIGLELYGGTPGDFSCGGRRQYWR